MTQLPNRPDYYFYFPYHEDSGVPMLFSRLANNIAACYPEINVFVIDYPDGAMARNILDLKNLKLIRFDEDGTVDVPANGILVMQSFVPYYWPRQLQVSAHARVYFWNLHPKNFVPSLLPIQAIRDVTFSNFGLYKTLSLVFKPTINKLRSFVKLLIRHKALSFMDQTNYDTTIKYLFIDKFETNYLPVPAANAITEFRKSSLINNNVINFGWVGRLCDFKAPILIYTANQLAQIALSQQTKIKYYIVGDGPFSDHVRSSIAENQYFELSFEGSLPNNVLDDFIINNIDVMTGMGTASLESAKFGIPTILLDFSYEKITGDYVFRWLHDTVNYDLGHLITKKDLRSGNDSLKQMLLQLLNGHKSVSDKAYSYFINNHSIDNIAGQFMNFADSSTLSFNNIDKKYLTKPLLLRLYNKLRKVDI